MLLIIFPFTGHPNSTSIQRNEQKFNKKNFNPSQWNLWHQVYLPCRGRKRKKQFVKLNSSYLSFFHMHVKFYLRPYGNLVFIHSLTLRKIFVHVTTRKKTHLSIHVRLKKSSQALTKNSLTFKKFLNARKFP